MLRYAYNTNGAANHRLDDALALIAECGYNGVALTLDHHHLDPFAPDLDRRAAHLDRRLRELGLGLVVETGARFLLDFRHKHRPTLLDPDPAGRTRRLDFLTRALDVCAACGGETVSFWSGPLPDGMDEDRAWGWLEEGVAAVAERAAERGVDASFEPEPGHLVDTLAGYDQLRRAAPGLRLALDTGHLIVTNEADPADTVRARASQLGTVAVEDMDRGVHLHKPFGTGDMDVPAVLAALIEVGFERLVTVELSRESPRAHEAIPESIRYLKEAEHSGALGDRAQPETAG
ncbi:MAG: sugar phosphate isomerase/epimerase family protein [Bacteroidota bacterium]